MLITLPLPNRSPLADALEILKSDCAICVFSGINKVLRDTMVHVFGKAAFFSLSFYEKACCRLRSFLLKVFSNTMVSFSETIEMPTRKSFAIGGGGDIFNTKINPKKILKVIRGWFLNLTGCGEVKFALYIKEVRFALLRFEQFMLFWPALIREFKSSINGPDRHKTFFGSIREDSLIVRNGAERPECSFCSLLKFIGVRHFGDGANHDLRRKVKLLPSIGIGGGMQGKLSKSFGGPGNFAEVVACRVCCLNCLLQRQLLAFVCNKFEKGNQFHKFKCRTFKSVVNHKIQKSLTERSGQFLPRLKPWVSLPVFHEDKGVYKLHLKQDGGPGARFELIVPKSMLEFESVKWLLDQAVQQEEA